MFPSEAEPLDLGSQAGAWEQVNFIIIIQSAEADIVFIVAVSTADSYCCCFQC